jgi:phosphatidylglycerophosphatase A
VSELKNKKMSVLDQISEMIWTVGRLGRMPMAPGTWGTVGAIPIYFLFLYLGWKIYLIGYLVIFLVGWYVSHRAERFYNNHDDKRIVIDEVSGYLTTMFIAPQNDLLPLSFLWGFVLFRLFDILKPGPIRRVDKIEGPLYVMLDDVLAGLFACVSLWIIASLLYFFKSPITLLLPEIFLR